MPRFKLDLVHLERTTTKEPKKLDRARLEADGLVYYLQKRGYSVILNDHTVDRVISDMYVEGSVEVCLDIGKFTKRSKYIHFSEFTDYSYISSLHNIK